jgi:L,D-peptidoglycan transpeptidase YkuD (ErfK/YbiS/YcfS/YnhG family)
MRRSDSGEVEHSGLKEQAGFATWTRSPRLPRCEHAAMRRVSFSTIGVHTRPGNRTRGVLLAGRLAIPVVLGRSGIRANKREGDGGTPGGRFRLVRLWWRPDRAPRPRTLLPTRHITPDLAWCEDTTDRRYNRPFRRSASEPGDRMWREDRLYDFVVEIDHNSRPRVVGRGSAVFVHVARPERSPTAGCVALSRNVLRNLLGRIGPKTRIRIHF